MIHNHLACWLGDGEQGAMLVPLVHLPSVQHQRDVMHLLATSVVLPYHDSVTVALKPPLFSMVISHAQLIECI